MLDWTNNIESISLNSSAGVCPNCKSENTDYGYTLLHGEWGACDIWCNDCKRAKHISRVKVPSGITESYVPNELIY